MALAAAPLRAEGGGPRDPRAPAPEPRDDPPAGELEALLGKLLEGYQDPAFQAELEAVRRASFAPGARVPLMLAMGPVVLRVQAPVLAEYGFPPSAAGVELLKHAVMRRVAEGATRLEELANEARRCLGIAAMPDRTLGLEEVLVRKVDETAQRMGAGLPETEAGLRRALRASLLGDAEAGALHQATFELLLGLVDGSEVSGPSLLSLAKMAKLRLSPAGLWFDLPLPTEADVLVAPTRDEFFRQHVLPNRPAVLRGAVDPERFPPCRDFADLGFLRRACGHRRVLVKSLAHSDREGRAVFVSDPELRLPFDAFLDGVEAHGRGVDGVGPAAGRVPFYLGKVPLRQELPELAAEIDRAPTCPGREYGSCFGDLVPDGVFTYFGCDRNTTAVHFDAHENLMLCVSGTKRLWLYPPSDARYLYPCNTMLRSAVVPFTEFEDLPAAAREKYALSARARHIEVNVRAGDILYLPSCWWHCVEGSEGANMILNWWFSLHPEKAVGPA